jgi:hypothetical protein
MLRKCLTVAKMPHRTDQEQRGNKSWTKQEQNENKKNFKKYSEHGVRMGYGGYCIYI